MKTQFLCVLVLALAVMSPLPVSGQPRERRLIVETSAPEPATAQPAKKWHARFFESADSALDIAADSVTHCLRQIELNYHVAYPYSAGVLVGFALVAVLLTSKFLSLLSRPQVRASTIRGHVYRREWSTARLQKAAPRTCCWYRSRP